MSSQERRLLDEQIAYYRARAPEYDDWFFRRGRYDRGAEHRDAWFAGVAEIERALERAGPTGCALELACGTGLWTRHLARTASSVTAVDASPEVLERNAQRVGRSTVQYVCADLFDWRPDRLFDFVFFGFWLSHVPPERFEAFWSGVRSALRPGGSAFFVDNARSPEIPSSSGSVIERSLDDGRRFRLVKVFYEPDALRASLERLGWSGFVRSAGEFFIYGCVEPALKP